MSEAFLPEYINLKMGLHPSSETSTNCQTQSFNLFLNFSKFIWTRVEELVCSNIPGYNVQNVENQPPRSPAANKENQDGKYKPARWQIWKIEMTNMENQDGKYKQGVQDTCTHTN